MVWICELDWSFLPVRAFRPLYTFRYFGDLEWFEYVKQIGHFLQSGHLDQLRLLGGLVICNGLDIWIGLVIFTSLGIIHWFRPFASLAIWNGLDMRNGLCIFTGLGIVTASHLWALCVGIFWTFEVDWSFSPISFPESSLPLTSGQKMRDYMHGSIHFRHAHRCRLQWNRMSRIQLFPWLVPELSFLARQREQRLWKGD